MLILLEPHRIGPSAGRVNNGGWPTSTHFEADRLKAFRSAVVDTGSGKALLEAVRAAQGAGIEVLGERYARSPAGYRADGEAARMLRFGALWTVEEMPAEALQGPDEVIGLCLDHWRAAAPIHRWLVDTLQAGARVVRS